MLSCSIRSASIFIYHHNLTRKEQCTLPSRIRAENKNSVCICLQERDPNASRAFVYDQYIQICAEHLGEAPGNSQADAPVTQAPQRESYLFEGQMSSVGLPSLQM